jgi:ABC-type transporter Mla maintaining outer membrane lipid asymmetry ATPase subunit MlaF
MHNGKTDSVSGFLLDDATEEERRECLMYKSGETVNLKPFSAQLEQQFTREVLPRLQMQQNSVTQELDNITQLLDDIAVLHQQHITSAPLSR